MAAIHLALVMTFAWYFLSSFCSKTALRRRFVLQQFMRRRKRRMALILAFRKKHVRRQRRAWLWPRNQFWFEGMLRGDYVEEWWNENFRMTRETFNEIVQFVGPDLEKQNTVMRDAISVERRLAIALWRLASGDTYRSTGLQFGIGRSTAFKITHEVCLLLTRLTSRFIKFPDDEEACAQNISSFENRSYFPQVVGCIDGSHIPLKKVQKDKKRDYYNRLKQYSIVLQGVADATYRFIDISVGYPGSIHDARIMRMSKLYRNIVQGKWLYSGPQKDIEGVEVGPLLVGDSAYPLTSWLLTPFRQTPTLTEEHTAFNKSLSQARVTIEQAFGILKGRWRILLKPLEEGVENAIYTTTACCVLHNICIIAGDPTEILPPPEDVQPYQIPWDVVREEAEGVRDAIFRYIND